MLAFVEGALGAWEVDVPEAEVIIRQQHLHIMGIFLNAFILFLQPLAHTLGHTLTYINYRSDSLNS